MSFINKFTGIRDLPDQAQGLMRRFLVIVTMNVFIFTLSSVFYILYIIDAIGFEGASIILAITAGSQLLIDYPSGSLGDWIGQRWVLAISYLLWAISFILLANATSFSNYVVMAVVLGVALAQNSGALGTWLDNNYQIASADLDPKRELYAYSTSRIGTINTALIAISTLLGGLLATLSSRSFVFLIESVGLFILMILVLLLVKDLKSDDPEYNAKPGKSVSAYFGYLKGGIQFLFSGKVPFFFILGSSVYFITWALWGGLILFPLYFAYSGTDILASNYKQNFEIQQEQDQS